MSNYIREMAAAGAIIAGTYAAVIVIAAVLLIVFHAIKSAA